jgi:hypothetical protein
MDSKRLKSLDKSVQSALDILREKNFLARTSDTLDPLPSLLEQCQTILQENQKPSPFRTLHHFACTGGTLISKAVSALPNTVLLSEIDPLSSVNIQSRSEPVPFAPTDILSGLNYSERPIDQCTYIEVFCAGINALLGNLTRQGYTLVIRDHAHSQFCTDVTADDRPTLSEILQTQRPVLGQITVRHPLDSFISLIKNKWLHFNPATLDDYARRYLQFLDRLDGFPIVHYERFVLSPKEILSEIADNLALPKSDLSMDFMHIMRVSGDSGRKSEVIEPRPRFVIPREMGLFDCDLENYEILCHRLGYDPDFAADPYNSW